MGNECKSSKRQITGIYKQLNSILINLLSDFSANINTLIDEINNCCEDTNGNYESLLEALDTYIAQQTGCCLEINIKLDLLNELIDHLCIICIEVPVETTTTEEPIIITTTKEPEPITTGTSEPEPEECNTPTTFKDRGSFYGITFQKFVDTDPGLIIFTYESWNIPDRFVVSWGGIVRYDTGYVGQPVFEASLNNILTHPPYSLAPVTVNPSTSGSVAILKTTPEQYVQVTVYAPMRNTAFQFTVSCPQPYTTTTTEEPEVTTTTEQPIITTTEEPAVSTTTAFPCNIDIEIIFPEPIIVTTTSEEPIVTTTEEPVITTSTEEICSTCDVVTWNIYTEGVPSELVCLGENIGCVKFDVGAEEMVIDLIFSFDGVNVIEETGITGTHTYSFNKTTATKLGYITINLVSGGEGSVQLHCPVGECVTTTTEESVITTTEEEPIVSTTTAQPIVTTTTEELMTTTTTECQRPMGLLQGHFFDYWWTTNSGGHTLTAMTPVEACESFDLFKNTPCDESCSVTDSSGEFASFGIGETVYTNWNMTYCKLHEDGTFWFDISLPQEDPTYGDVQALSCVYIVEIVDGKIYSISDPCCPVATTTTEEPVITTTEEPVTTTTEEPTITTTTDYCDPLMVYEIYPNYGVTIDSTFYSRKDSYDLANQGLCEYIGGSAVLNASTIFTQQVPPVEGCILFQMKQYGECVTLNEGYYSWIPFEGDPYNINDYVILHVDSSGEIIEVLATTECPEITTTTEP